MIRDVFGDLVSRLSPVFWLNADYLILKCLQLPNSNSLANRGSREIASYVWLSLMIAFSSSAWVGALNTLPMYKGLHYIRQICFRWRAGAGSHRSGRGFRRA